MGFEWQAFRWWLDLFREKEIHTADEDPPEDRPLQYEDVLVQDRDEEPKEDREEDPWSLRSVGAWVGWGSMVSFDAMKRDIKFAKDLGLGRLDVIVNDHSGSRAERDFGTYHKDRITSFCQMAKQDGFRVHLMSWWMPHARYIREAGKQLVDLAGASSALSIQLDAEEPWTQARKPMNWEDAADLTAEVLSSVSFGVTGIGYTPSIKVGPLVRRAQYMVPQCYSTSSNKLDPATASPRLCGRWRRLFGERELVVGLAGYRQSGRQGYTKERFMDLAFHAAESTQPTDIVYWSLRHIRGTRSTAKIIGRLAKRARYAAARG